MPDPDEHVPGEAERFAAAVEPRRAAEALGSAVADAPLARDLEIVATLRALGAARSTGSDADPLDPGALADARARVRARVMAALAADLAETGPAATGERAPDGTGSGSSGGAARVAAGAGPVARRAKKPVGATRGHRGHRRHALRDRPAPRPAAPSPGVARRAAFVGAAALVVAIAVVAGGILASRDAVPGEPLYGVKRAAEEAGGIFATGDGPRARLDLHLATTRVDEVERLARDAADPSLLEATIRDLGASAAAGARLALTERRDGAAGHDDAAVDLVAWTNTQTARLTALRAALPTPALGAVEEVLRLLDRVHDRALALAARIGCAQVSTGTTDDVGPLPADAPCEALPNPVSAADLVTATPDPAGPAGPAAADPVDPRSTRSGPDPTDEPGADPTRVDTAASTTTTSETGAPRTSRTAGPTTDPAASGESSPDTAAAVPTTGTAPTPGSGPLTLPSSFTVSLLPGGR